MQTVPYCYEWVGWPETFRLHYRTNYCCFYQIKPLESNANSFRPLIKSSSANNNNTTTKNLITSRLNYPPTSSHYTTTTYNLFCVCRRKIFVFFSFFLSYFQIKRLAVWRSIVSKIIRKWMKFVWWFTHFRIHVMTCQ